MQAMMLNASRYDWSTWLMGIFRSLIAASAGAIASPVGPMVLDPKDYNLGDGLHKVVISMLITAGITGVTGMAIFLKTHPGPDQLQQALAKASIESDKAVVQAAKASDAVADAKTVAIEAHVSDKQ